MSRTVLVVDDDPGLRDLLGEFLAEAGFAVRRAGDGQEAQETLTRTPVDLILSDVEMPRVGGPALAARLRERGDRTPVVLMSADGPPPEAAGLPFVRKPFDFEDMLGTVTRALGNSEAPQPDLTVPAIATAPAEWAGAGEWGQAVIRETRALLGTLDQAAHRSMEQANRARDVIALARQLLTATARRIDRWPGVAGPPARVGPPAPVEDPRSRLVIIRSPPTLAGSGTRTPPTTVA